MTTTCPTRPGRDTSAFEIEMVRHLLYLKKTGALAEVWIDAGVIRVAWPNCSGCRHRIEWSEVAAWAATVAAWRRRAA